MPPNPFKGITGRGTIETGTDFFQTPLFNTPALSLASLFPDVQGMNVIGKDLEGQVTAEYIQYWQRSVEQWDSFTHEETVKRLPINPILKSDPTLRLVPRSVYNKMKASWDMQRAALTGGDTTQGGARAGRHGNGWGSRAYKEESKISEVQGIRAWHKQG